LLEIYGINKHITEVCQNYSVCGYDIFCPNLLCLTKPYDYSQQNEAYKYFIDNIGFEIYLKVNELIEQLRLNYKK